MTRDTVPAWLPAAAQAAATLVTTLGHTWRFEHAHGFASLDARLRAGEPCIFAFWHDRLLPLAFHHRDRGIAVLISRHRDGEWIARVIQRLGYRTPRGSSTRGGDVGLREMLAMAAEGHQLGITPDGPRGPARQVKPGLIYLASRLQWPIVPITAAVNRAWVLASWDRFRVPQPFARVHVAYGEPVRVPPDLDETGEREWCLMVERAMDEISRRSAASVGEAA